jgi:hypothetical protein
VADEQAPAAEATPVKAPAQPATGKADGAKGKAGGKDGAKGKGGGKDKGKDKKGKSAKGATRDAGDGPSLAGHPRASTGVARAKAWGGLAGFLLGGYLSLPTHSLAEAGLRALVAGVVCYVAVWASAVFVWRRLVAAELRHAQHEALNAELAKRGLTPAPALLPAPDGRRAAVGRAGR